MIQPKWRKAQQNFVNSLVDIQQVVKHLISYYQI